jgi:hypothetical protein
MPWADSNPRSQQPTGQDHALDRTATVTGFAILPVVNMLQKEL